MATGNRKHGRNKTACKRYRDENRDEKAKKRNIARHERRYPKVSTKTAVQRRAMGRAWKAEEERRLKEAAKIRTMALRKQLGLSDLPLAL